MRQVTSGRKILLVTALAGIAAGGWWGLSRLRGPSFDPVEAPSAIEGWRTLLPERAAVPAPPARKWIVIGWDGADWDLLLPLLDAGKMPNLAALMREGAYGAMRSHQPTWSPVLWTTVATGTDPGRHGVMGWGREERKSGLRTLFTNRDRRVHALWNLLTERGRTSLVVGYHNTYPAERIQGLMVSNFLFQVHLASTVGAAADRQGAVSPLVFPPERLPEVLALAAEAEASIPVAMPRFARYGPEEATTFESPIPGGFTPDLDTRVYFLKKAYLLDAFNLRVGLREYPRLQPDLFLLHFQCLDFAAHYFLYFHRPERFAGMAWTAEQRAELDGQRARYAGTIEAFHAWADEALGQVLAAREPGTAVLLLSDHGFEPDPDPSRTGCHTSAPPGMFVVSGPGILPGYRPEGASLYDVLPTVAAALGLPVAEDLPGRVQEGWFWSPPRVERVASYDPDGRYVPEVPETDETHPGVLDELKALGYIR